MLFADRSQLKNFLGSSKYKRNVISYSCVQICVTRRHK